MQKKFPCLASRSMTFNKLVQKKNLDIEKIFILIFILISFSVLNVLKLQSLSFYLVFAFPRLCNSVQSTASLIHADVFFR